MVYSKRYEIRKNRSSRRSRTLFRAVLFIPLAFSAVLGFGQGGERGPDGRRISEKVTPFKIVGNIHYVGGTDMTVFLITTPEGHILIDSTYERDAPWIRQNVEELGFNMSDIEIMLNSHAHADHIEAHVLMKELTGAQVVMSEADGATLAEGGGVGTDGRTRYQPVQPDRIIRTGDTVTLGGTTLTAHVFPGHTRPPRGATTWTMMVEDGGQDYTFVFWGRHRRSPAAVREQRRLAYHRRRLCGHAAESEATVLRVLHRGTHGRLRTHRQDEPPARGRATESLLCAARMPGESRTTGTRFSSTACQGTRRGGPLTGALSVA